MSVRCLIMGYGFLGRALVRRLAERGLKGLKVVAIANSKGFIYREAGIELSTLPERIEALSDFRSKEPRSLIDKRAVDLLVELTPTDISSGEPGLTHLKEALSQGIDAVTSNKGPLVLAFRELHRIAEESGALLRYEATVGGGIPVFSLARSCLKGDELLSICGILNGTTNYILTRMHFEGMSLDLALREAKMLGIAEKDPTLDVEGIDTACKVVILANSLMGLSESLEGVSITGIRRITAEAIAAAKESGMAIKLIGSIKPGRLSVEPRLVRLNHPLCVHGTLNALNLKSSVLGDLTLIGQGAGESTVASLLNDIHEVVSIRSR